MNKKTRKILASILVLLILLTLSGCNPKYNSTLKANWGFSFPSKAKLVQEYKASSKESFHGDGIRYHVFSYKDEELIFNSLSFSSNDESTLFHNSRSKAADDWLNSIKIPIEWMPNYENTLSWYQSQEDNSEIIIFIDKDKDYLYIVEQFM